jgi:uncharacterized membrane protein
VLSVCLLQPVSLAPSGYYQSFFFALGIGVPGHFCGDFFSWLFCFVVLVFIVQYTGWWPPFGDYLKCNTP